MSGKMRYTILGCGSSPGTPRIHGDWGACDPNNPKNNRLRCSFMVEKITDDGITRVIVDTSPDFRQQMIRAKVDHIDGVLYTHAHADHVHGIDDLRGYMLVQKHRVNIYADEETSKRIYQGFGYCLEQPEGSMYPPILRGHDLVAYKSLTIDGAGGLVHILPILQVHGGINSLGFRFSSTENFDDGGLCYSPDVSDFPQESLPLMENLDCLILDALQYREHVSHLSVEQAIEWIERISPKRAIFTHMHIPLDYETLKAELPDHIEPGYDGLSLEL